MNKLRTYVFGLALLVTACAGVTIASVVALVVTNAKTACSLVVDAEGLAKALTGLDPSTINVVALVNSICTQFTTLASQPATPSVLPPLGVAAEKCYNVVVNTQPVKVCK